MRVAAHAFTRHLTLPIQAGEGQEGRGGGRRGLYLRSHHKWPHTKTLTHPHEGRPVSPGATTRVAAHAFTRHLTLPLQAGEGRVGREGRGCRGRGLYLWSHHIWPHTETLTHPHQGRPVSPGATTRVAAHAFTRHLTLPLQAGEGREGRGCRGRGL